MELSYKQKTRKYLIFALIILLAHLFQNTAGLSLEIGNAHCFILLPIVIILGMGEDEKWSALLGLFGGMLWDMTSSTQLGFSAIFMCIMCFISAALVTYIVRDTFITAMIFSGVTIVLFCFLYWLFFIIFKNIAGAELSLFTHYMPSAIYTLFVTPLLWLFLRPIKKKLNKPKKEIKN